jgi:hypothetical protein
LVAILDSKCKICCTIWRPSWFAMVAILNQKWPPKYKDPPIWEKFCFQVDYDVSNWYPSLKFFHFWISNNLFWFYIGGHFEMAAILKILKIKSTILSDDLFLCQVSKGSVVRNVILRFGQTKNSK